MRTLLLRLLYPYAIGHSKTRARIHTAKLTGNQSVTPLTRDCPRLVRSARRVALPRCSENWSEFGGTDTDSRSLIFAEQGGKLNDPKVRTSR